MCKVQMIGKEQGFISFPVTKAVYCEHCEQISNSAWLRCGQCGSEAILRLVFLIDGPPPGPEPLATVLSPASIEVAA